MLFFQNLMNRTQYEMRFSHFFAIVSSTNAAFLNSQESYSVRTPFSVFSKIVLNTK